VSSALNVSPDASRDEYRVVIEPARRAGGEWRELWSYRELFFFFAWRDLIVRYKQTFLGVAWAALRPLIAIALLSFVFSRLAGLQAEGGVPYSVFVLTGLLPWQLVSTGLADASQSLILQANLVSKVYFPRILVPASALSVSVADGAVSLVLMGLLLVYHGLWPGLRLLALPACFVLAVGTALGVGIWLSALTVRWRDLRVAVPFLVQVSLYASPVAYRAALIPEAWRPVFEINPLVGIIAAFRWCLIPGTSLETRAVLLSLTVTVLLLVTGLRYFRATERHFADVI
jgi:lipopolysaccharide transport system permease protein